MTNFEEITKDTESLAKFLTLNSFLKEMVSDGFYNYNKCSYCIAQNECDKLKETGDTYRLCVRSWCAWLNKEYDDDI